MTRHLARLALVLLALGAALAPLARAQDVERPAAAQLDPARPAGAASDAAVPGGAGPAAADASDAESGRLSTAVEIAVVLTVLSLLPAVLITITSFTRIVILLSFVRRALSVNELPPNPVIVGLALFLTVFVMGPVAERVWTNAWLPYQSGEASAAQAAHAAWGDLAGFLVANTRPNEIALFADLADHEGELDASAPADLPVRIVVPAFVLSELKTAFQMGFLLFLPFLVIDLIVSSVLLSMGMFMLPPVMISTPFKILVFVLVDGWHLVCQSAVTSFVTT